jgi:hypothetical protein
VDFPFPEGVQVHYLANAGMMLTLAEAFPYIDLVGTSYVSNFSAETYDIHSLRLALSGMDDTTE